MRSLLPSLVAALPLFALPMPSAALVADERTGLLRGSVVDSDGRGVANALVRAMTIDESTGVIEATVDARTDGNGAFVIQACPTGRLLVVAEHPEFASPAAATPIVDRGREPTEVRLDLLRGGRIVGTVRNRAGQPLADAKVAFFAASEAPSLSRRPPVAVRPNGVFDMRGVPTGQGTLVAMVDAGGPRQRIATETIEVLEGDTTTASLVTTEVAISGQVMRSGQPGSNLRVTVTNRTPSNERRLAESAFGLDEGTGRGSSTTTDQDGAFTVTADAPGPAFVQVTTLDRGMYFPSRELDVPDNDWYDLELSVGGSAVTGVVTDRNTGQTLEGASVCADPTRPAASPKPYVAGSCTRTDAEGAFRVELEPGGYVLRASDFERGYRTTEIDVSVPDSGLDEANLSIEKAPSIQARTVDAQGRAIADAFVTACDDQRRCVLRGGPDRRTDSDDRLRFQDLEQRPYNLFAISLPAGTVGFRAGVLPGPDDVVVTLRPASKVTVRAMGTRGPVPGAQVVVRAIDGHSVAVIHRAITDAQGVAVLSAPAGNIELAVSNGHLEGHGLLAVASGTEGEVTVAMASARAPAVRSR